MALTLGYLLKSQKKKRPGVHSKSFGFFVFPGPDKANSVVTHLPKITAPSSLSNFTK